MPVKILLVEDNEGDAELVVEALRTNKIVVSRLDVAQTGEDALDFLHQRGVHRGTPRPDLVILDLNLPGISGRDVLASIKSDDDLKAIPVVVMTTSRAEEDVHNAYDLHANCYVTKPVDMDEFIRVVQKLDEFWFAIVKLPGRPV